MTKPQIIVGLVNETINLDASTKKSSAYQKSAKAGAEFGHLLADVARYSQFLLTDRLATIGFGNVIVALVIVKANGSYIPEEKK